MPDTRKATKKDLTPTMDQAQQSSPVQHAHDSGNTTALPTPVPAASVPLPPPRSVVSSPAASVAATEHIINCDFEKLTKTLERVLEEKLDDKLKPLFDGFDKFTKVVQDNVQEVKLIANTVNDNTKKITELDQEVIDLRQEIAMQACQIKRLEAKLDKTEAEKRRYNIVIRGVDEQTHPNPHTAVDLLFQTIASTYHLGRVRWYLSYGSCVPKTQDPSPDHGRA